MFFIELSKVHSLIVFVKGVNLTLKPGAKVALVGPSGGGKV